MADFILILTLIDPNGSAFIRDIPMANEQACNSAGEAWKAQQDSNYSSTYTFYRANFLCVPTAAKKEG